MDIIILKLITKYGMIALPFGYIAMRLSTLSRWKSENKEQNIFITLLYATVIFYSSWFLQDLKIMPETITYLLSIGLTFIFALAWCKITQKYVVKISRYYGLSYENHKGTTLEWIFGNGNHLIDMVAVYTHDGCIYMCHSLSHIRHQYKDAGFSIEKTGIAMPVTHFRNKDSTEFKDISEDLDYEWQGIKHTYIPADQIRKINVSIKKR